MAGYFFGMSRPTCKACKGGKCDYFSQDDFGYKFCDYGPSRYRHFVDKNTECPACCI